MKLIQGQLDEFQIYTYIFSQYEVELPYILWSNLSSCIAISHFWIISLCLSSTSIINTSLLFFFSLSYSHPPIYVSLLFLHLSIPLLLHIPIILISPIFCFPFLSTSTTLHVSLDAAHPASLSIPPSSSSPLSLFLLLSLLFLLSSVFPTIQASSWLIGVPSGGSRDGSHSRPSETSASGSRTSKAKSRRRFGTCSRRSTKRATPRSTPTILSRSPSPTSFVTSTLVVDLNIKIPSSSFLVDSIYRWWRNKIHIWSVTFNVI